MKRSFGTLALFVVLVTSQLPAWAVSRPVPNELPNQQKDYPKYPVTGFPSTVTWDDFEDRMTSTKLAPVMSHLYSRGTQDVANRQDSWLEEAMANAVNTETKQRLKEICGPKMLTAPIQKNVRTTDGSDSITRTVTGYGPVCIFVKQAWVANGTAIDALKYVSAVNFRVMGEGRYEPKIQPLFGPNDCGLIAIRGSVVKSMNESAREQFKTRVRRAVAAGKVPTDSRYRAFGANEKAAGHVPDAVWGSGQEESTNQWSRYTPPIWIRQDHAVNSDIGRQSQRYPDGFWGIFFIAVDTATGLPYPPFRYSQYWNILDPYPASHAFDGTPTPNNSLVTRSPAINPCYYLNDNYN
jgi:hypothetical protein